MLDVHPPHQAAHTWKDFFIHIATICIGLLIAIGLEQTVEAIHHASERHELTEEMHAESEHNLTVLESDVGVGLSLIRWNQSLISALRSAAPQNGWIAVTVPARSQEDRKYHKYPSRAAWASVKTNGKVALLSERQSSVYDRLDYNAERATSAADREGLATAKVEGDQMQLGIHLRPGTTVSLSADAVSGLTYDLAQLAAADEVQAHWDNLWLACSHAVVDNVRDREDFVPYLDKAIKDLAARESALK